MAVKDQFSEDEWFLVSSVPGMVGAAVATAGKSGPIGTSKELVASMSGVLEGRKTYPDNDLITSLLTKAEDKEEARTTFDTYRDKALEKLKGKSKDELRQQTLSDLKQVNSVLAAKLPSKEAEEYKAWILAMAEDVAKSAKEGGFLGVGGEQVSEGERTILEEIRAALA